ncbi:uncharacterized protein LOC109844783 [Asparagus officinalis]|uniref:uncharacterized protein LOC109844783 n=1 Tax=Asparagus officinalis TaxID=4686 RepID=UPI00098E1CB2|nr:uncharacterized protein LOC109844783 [Asparagus officinalis]
MERSREEFLIRMGSKKDMEKIVEDGKVEGGVLDSNGRVEDGELLGVRRRDGRERRWFGAPPRLVFGPAPTLQEAEEATADLKEAIEKVYFSSAIAEDSIKASQVSNVGESAAVVPSVSKHVVQAFSLLQGSPEAQSVVASLACDKNVWDAVMKNDKVMEFYNKHQTVILSSETNVAPEEFTEENVINLEGLFAETMESHEKETSEDSAFFTDIMQNIKVKVSEIVSKITGFLQDFVGGLSESQDTTNPRTTTSTWDKYGDLPIGASFLALAVAAILVILVKRG